MDLPPEEIELREIPDLRMPLLQIALLRRSMEEFAGSCARCAHCERTVLAGENIFLCPGERMVCQLCIGFEPEPPVESRLVHGPEFGHTIRIVDQRSVQAPRIQERDRAPVYHSSRRASLTA
jgi:hypothetical protein